MRPWIAVTLLLVPACSGTRGPAAPAANVVTITASEFAFGMPDTIPAGLTTFRLLNHGREPHQAAIIGAPGKSFAELEAAAVPKRVGSRVVACVLRPPTHFPGGPGVVMGGDSSIITTNLTPGNYLIVCFVPSPDGKWHVQKGMFHRLVVTPAPTGATAASEAHVGCHGDTVRLHLHRRRRRSRPARTPFASKTRDRSFTSSRSSGWRRGRRSPTGSAG